jgi:hypothetical protein
MSDNSQKTHLGEALNAHALLKALNQVHGIAKCLPATAGGIAGSIMGALNFETSGTSGPPKASIPHFGPEYLRYPTQPGDKGVHIGQHTNIGNMSGQGPSGGSALDNSNSNTGASSSGVFMPIANTNWEAAPSGNMLCHYGVNPQQQQGGGGGGGGEQQPYGVALYDQVFSKQGGSFLISTPAGQASGNSKTTAVLRIGAQQTNKKDTSITADYQSITLQANKVITHQSGTDNGNKSTVAINNTTIEHTAPTSVDWTTPQSTHTGTVNVQKNVNVSQNLNVTQISSLLGGVTSGALEVAADIDGGLVECTMGLEVTSGTITDTLQVLDGAVFTAGGVSITPIPIASLPSSPSAGAVNAINNGIASPAYHQTVSATGADTWLVLFTGTGWVYL